MPKNHSRVGFHLNILHRIALNLGKIAHLFLRKGNILNFSRGKALASGLDFSLRKPKIARIPLIKFSAIVANCLITTHLNILDDAFYGIAHLRRIFRPYLYIFATFEISNHDLSSQPVLSIFTTLNPLHTQIQLAYQRVVMQFR